MNISRNLAFGRREKIGIKKASGGAKKAIRGHQKKVATFYFNFLSLCWAPFGFSGRTSLNYVTPLTATDIFEPPC